MIAPKRSSRGGRRTRASARNDAAPRVRVTFEGRLIVLSLAIFTFAALTLGESLVLLAGSVALSVTLASRLLVARNLEGVGVNRHLPGRGRAGVPVGVGYEVENAEHGRAAGLTLEDPLCSSARPRQLEIQIPGVPPGRKVRHEEPVTFVRRGRFTLGAPRLRTRFPLGFFEKIRPMTETDAILVRPREGRPTMRLKMLLSGQARAFHRPSVRVRGDDVFHGVRDFRDGDDPRRIHWKTTARTGALAVSEWHREEGRDVVVVLGRADGMGPDRIEAFERAVTVAATAIRLAARHGLHVRLALGNRTATGRVEAPRSGVRAGLDSLALVKPQGGRQPRGLLRSLGASPGGRIVLYVAAGPEPGIERRLQAAAGPQGEAHLLRADKREILRWVRGFQ